jgi:hypothetical protein
MPLNSISATVNSDHGRRERVDVPIEPKFTFYAHDAPQVTNHFPALLDAPARELVHLGETPLNVFGWLGTIEDGPCTGQIRLCIRRVLGNSNSKLADRRTARTSIPSTH